MIIYNVAMGYFTGQKIKFESERQSYTIRACDDRFLICTKPFNVKKTVLYTIVDLHDKIRGTEGTIFCRGFEQDKQCAEALKRVQSGDSLVSFRNRIALDIRKIS